MSHCRPSRVLDLQDKVHHILVEEAHWGPKVWLFMKFWVCIV